MKCIEIEEIAELAQLDADDPRRQHLESCIRCRNLARSYAAFMKAEAGLDADRAAARTHLVGVIDRLADASSGAVAGGESARVDVPRDEGPVRTMGPRRPRRPWPLWRIGTASLVAAAAIVLMFVVFRPQEPSPPTVLRTEHVGHTPTLSLLPAEPIADVEVRLSWTHPRNVDAFEVRIYGAELDEIYRHTTGRDTTLTVRLADIPVPPDSPGLIWRVYAYRGSDVVAISAPGSIPLH